MGAFDVDIFTWWIGDHEPPHVHLYDDDGKFIPRKISARCSPWIPLPSRKLSPALISQLQKEGRL